MYGCTDYLVAKLSSPMSASFYNSIYGPPCRAFLMMKLFLRRRFNSLHPVAMKRRMMVELRFGSPRSGTRVREKGGWEYLAMEKRVRQYLDENNGLFQNSKE
jgi:hypothetical protein